VQEAEKTAEVFRDRLKRARKLALIVDLDKTVIHTTRRQYAETWAADPASGIHEV
jgi:TFIIF-interacting CTD phosphatase-like protein